MQGLTIILTYIPLVVAALNSSLTISPTSERAVDFPQASAEILESVSSVISAASGAQIKQGPTSTGREMPLTQRAAAKTRCSILLNLQDVNLKCFYTRYIKKKKVTKG